MASIFEYSDYRKALQFLIKTFPGKQHGLQTRLAGFIGCQQAYVSRVLCGNAELSQEQALAASQFFNLDSLEQEYFLNLVCLNRAGSADLRRFYEKKRSEILNRKLEIKSRIKQSGELSAEVRTAYYGEWLYAAAHMATAVPSLATPPAMASRFGVSEQRMREVLEFLEQAGLIEKKGSRYFGKVASIHLGRESALVRAHHTNWRLKALEALSKKSPNALNYSSVVSCGLDDSVRIREILLKALQDIRDVVRESPSEQLYCYNLDFFEV
jgi:uncharacterized protein (TIGR02147 family)